MRANNLIKVIILNFLLSAVFVSAVGCENTPSDKLPSGTESGEQNPSQPEQDTPSDTELAMAKKWEEIIVDVNTDVKSADVRKYIIQPSYSSIATKVQVIKLDDPVVIENLLNLVRELDVSFEDFEFDSSGLTDFTASHVGKEMIEIMLKDSVGTEIFGLCLYENGDIDIIEAREVTETKKTYRHTYRVYFEDSNNEVFADFQNFYNTNIIE